MKVAVPCVDSLHSVIKRRPKNCTACHALVTPNSEACLLTHMLHSSACTAHVLVCGLAPHFEQCASTCRSNCSDMPVQVQMRCRKHSKWPHMHRTWKHRHMLMQKHRCRQQSKLIRLRPKRKLMLMLRFAPRARSSTQACYACCAGAAASAYLAHYYTP